MSEVERRAQKVIDERLAAGCGRDDEVMRVAMDALVLSQRYQRLKELTADKPKRDEIPWEHLILNVMNVGYEQSTLQQVEDWAGSSGRRPVSVVFEFDSAARERTRASLEFRYPDWYENRSSRLV